MHGHHFLTDLGIALLAALAGGLVARLLRLPLLVGYLMAGVVIGPHTPGFVAAQEAVGPVSELGVTLLMFAVGTHLSLRDLMAVRRIALLGGGIQLVATILLGLVLGLVMGWGAYGGLFLGCALALSSTAVMMRLLEERGELGSAHGTAMMGILVLQDLAVVLMVALLPALATLSSQGVGAMGGVGLSLLKALGSVTLALVLALRVVPAILSKVARTGSQELFLLVVVCICLGAAYLAQQIGLSIELGAFLAGVVISESDYAHEVFSQVRPLRDVFASLFFVSVGMLLNPTWVGKHLGIVTATVLAVVLGKSLITLLAVWLSKAHGRVAVLCGLGLAQVGEFSVVLVTLGTRRHLIAEEIAGTVLSTALITILLTPFLFGGAGKVYQALNRIPALSRLLNRSGASQPVVAEAEDGGPAKVLILGAGRVGRYVSEALTSMRVCHAVIDYDAHAIERRRGDFAQVVYGDATSEVVLEHVHPSRARLAVVALPEAAVTEMVIRLLRRMAPEIQILARVHRGVDIPRVRAAGANSVIHGEFEAGSEMIRQGLCRLGFEEPNVTSYLEHVRERRYRTRWEDDPEAGATEAPTTPPQRAAQLP